MKSLAIAVVIGASLVTGAQAAEVPELTGTWSGSGASVSESEGWETSRSLNLVISEQRGPVFKGNVQYEGGEDDFLGAIKADGKTILITDDDGTVSATLLNPDEMEVCYVAGDDDEMTANCAVVKRSE